jgi:hypothetical protein
VESFIRQCAFCLLFLNGHGKPNTVPFSQVSFVASRDRMTRAYKTWWIGLALAVAVGLSTAAPRANAGCAASHFSFCVPQLPFDEGFQQAKAPKHSEPNPAPCPCKGPHCHKVPAGPTAPPSAPPRSTSVHDWAWVDSLCAPPQNAGASWVVAEGTFRPLSSPSPLERPPR